jgi:hypothetical protein
MRDRALRLSGCRFTLLTVLWDDNAPLDELAAFQDAEELCRRLLASPWGWGSSTSHIEAVELLTTVHGTSELPASFVALMVCTCGRWDRVTTRLIAAVEDSALLDGAELDDLAESFLSHEHVISYPLAWASPQWLEVELDTGNARTYTVDDDTLAQHRPLFGAGQPNVRCARTRLGSTTCSMPPASLNPGTAMPSSTGCSTPPTRSTKAVDGT